MKSILEEFAYGNISPEARSFKRNSQYGEAMRSVSGNFVTGESLIAGREDY